MQEHHTSTRNRAKSPKMCRLIDLNASPTESSSTSACELAHKPFVEEHTSSFLSNLNRCFILDPRGENVHRWNRVILIARGVSLAVDPLYFLSISVCGGKSPCFYINDYVARVATVLRTCADIVHLCHLCMRFRLAYVSKESLVIGCGKLVWDPRLIVHHYLSSMDGFWFDAFVILPIPQVVYGLLVPTMLRKNRVQEMISILQLTFFIQFVPKIFHCFCLMQGMREATGYIFGSIWWGFSLNLIAYFLASHASGGYWYILAIRRIASCVSQNCIIEVCEDSCIMEAKKHKCLDPDGPFPYGIYQFALPIMLKNSVTKTLYSNLWGLLTLSTMANNLEPTSELLEIAFSISMVLAGLMLFTMLIGNIQVFLHTVMVRRRKMQLRYRDIEVWMKHRQLPSVMRKRVRRYEQQRWEMMGGHDEMELIKDLPEGLRRDIKRYVCLDLIKKVPLFHNLNGIVLDNICDRVKPLVFSKHEKIIREGDPVQQMIFIVHGKVERTQSIGKCSIASNTLRSGTFLGDELISWCLSNPCLRWKLPVSSASFNCIRPTEGFGLKADDLKYIIDHFRYPFAKEGLKRTARYYSSNWRTWGAINIQLAWHNYRRRKNVCCVNTRNSDGDSEKSLMKYAAMFMSFRPHDHLE